MLEEQEKERLRTLTVEVLLELRGAYLSTYGSRVSMAHWEQIQNRMRSATRTTTGPEEWVTDLCRSLRLVAQGPLGCAAVVDLVAAVRERSCATAWLDLIDREWGYIMALTRLSAEKRKADRAEKNAAAAGREET